MEIPKHRGGGIISRRRARALSLAGFTAIWLPIWIRSQLRPRRQGKSGNCSIYTLALPAKCDLLHTY